MLDQHFEVNFFFEKGSNLTYGPDNTNNTQAQISGKKKLSLFHNIKKKYAETTFNFMLFT